jgi:hypothetical protein
MAIERFSGESHVPGDKQCATQRSKPGKGLGGAGWATVRMDGLSYVQGASRQLGVEASAVVPKVVDQPGTHAVLRRGAEVL